MLCLKRNVNQTIQIGQDIVIVLLDSGHGWAKIGIEAPRTTEVIRPDAKNQTPRQPRQGT